MEEIIQKINELKAGRQARLCLRRDSPLFRYNGVVFPVLAVGSPHHNCRVKIRIHQHVVSLPISEVDLPGKTWTYPKN